MKTDMKDKTNMKMLYATKGPILDRIEETRNYLIDSNCLKEQKHLDAGSEPRDYWHFGYMIGLRDALKMVFGNDDA